MSISKINDNFIIETKNTSYAFTMFDEKFPVHLYYGKKCDCAEMTVPKKYAAFSAYYEKYGHDYSPDCAAREIPFFDDGDFRTTALKVRGNDGNCVTEFTYTGFDIIKGRYSPKGLPCADPDEKTETLIIHMKDDVRDATLDLYYSVFPECDVITRYSTLTNNSDNNIKIEKSMSLTLDIPEGEYDCITLMGRYAHEREYQRLHLGKGMYSISSRRGASSHMQNPFFAVCGKDAAEETGEVYGFNLVYSGSFLCEAETDQSGCVRIQTGLGEEEFGMLLCPGESFDCPEACMTYSENGIGGMSRSFHDFIRGHILPPEPFDHRPVVLNCWEATYFDISEKILLEFADAAKKVGIDMLVMDDGWFGKRDDDHAGLGDWFPNKKKFPEGLSAFIDKVKSKGIKFGIWIEPEMVNPDSDLYRAHPEWCISAPEREGLLSRNQLVLDMANDDVIDYLENIFEKTLGSLDIDYIKWDYNRNMCRVASPALPPERQDEVRFRNMLGVYRLYDWFKKRFPNIMLENCSGGGGRYDLGMMKYSTQIWTSDNTDSHMRIPIQFSSTIGYPPYTMSCHVSNANSQTSDPHALDFAYRVAIGGPLGYELHLPDMPDGVKKTIAGQILQYREWEKTILSGDFYRVHNPFECGCYSYYFISKDKNHILVTFLNPDGADTDGMTMKINAPDGKYIDELTGKIYDSTELANGITISTEKETNSYRMLSLRKILK